MRIENIKFKAKSILDGAWVQGDLIHKEDGKIAILRNGFNVSEVDPSTVCQFTGIMDEDCNEIWEGDIVRDTEDLLCIDNLYEVVYIEEEGNFAFKSLDKVDNYEPFVNLFNACVVGNKFDKENSV